MDWQLIVIIVLGGLSVSLVFVYLSLFFYHWRNLRKEFAIKDLYNKIAVMPLHNSRIILERLAEQSDDFKGGADFLSAADTRLVELMRSLREQITALERSNIDGDYSRSKKIARRLEPTLHEVIEAVERLRSQINAPADFNHTFDRILVEYRRHYEQAVSIYEKELLKETPDSKIVEGAKFQSSSLLETADNEKFKVDTAARVRIVGELHEKILRLCQVVYKPPKLRYLKDVYVPGQIAAIEQEAIKAQALGIIADFEWVKEILAEVRMRQGSVHELLQDMDIYEAEEHMKEALQMLDLVQNTLHREQNAASLLQGLGKSASITIEKAVQQRAVLTELLTATSAAVSFSAETKDIFQKVINETVRLQVMHRQVVLEVSESTAFSDVCDQIQSLASRLLAIKKALRDVSVSLQKHADLHTKTSVEVANLRLALHDMQFLLEQERSDLLNARFEATILSQQSELQDIETQIRTGSVDIEGINDRLKYAQTVVKSLLVQISAFKAEANVAERMIVYVSKFRNEDPDIANVLMEAENKFVQGDYVNSLQTLMPAVRNIKRSAAINKLKLS